MTDEPAQATAHEPDPSRERARIEPTSSAKSTDLLPGLYLLGFIVLAGAMYYLWSNPPETRLATQDSNRVDTLQTQIAALRDDVNTMRNRPPTPPGASEAEFGALQQQVASLAARPVPPPVSLQPLESKVTALESRSVATPEQVAQLSTQVLTLAKQTPDVGPLTQRIDAMEKRPQFDPSTLQAAQTQMGGQMQALSSKVDDLAKALAEMKTDVAARLDATEAKAAQSQKDVSARLDANDAKAVQAQKDAGGKLDALTAQSQQTADQLKTINQKLVAATRLQGAATALSAGTKLGDIPGAPPALARFANEAPPTESGLRGSFDSYANKAADVSQAAASDNQSFADRMWNRAQQTVTVRQGDHVLVGDPISGLIAHARELLDNGDLAGAVKSLDGLSGAPAEAMKPWVERAKSLLDARSALASMAAG